MPIINMMRRVRRAILKHLIPEVFYPKTILIDGVVVPIRNSKFSFGIRRYLLRGDYERPERDLVKRIVDDADNCLEFGSSIGVLSSILANKVGPSGRVFCVEADEHLVPVATQWVTAQFKNVEVRHGIGLPVWELPSDLHFKFEEGEGSLGGRVRMTANGSNEKEGVTCFDISTVMRVAKFIPTVLVVDIEGSESLMLDCKPNLPEQIKKIIMEFHPDIYGFDCMNRIIGVLATEGYEVDCRYSNTLSFLRR